MWFGQNETRKFLFTADARFAVSRVEGKPVTLSGYALKWNELSSDRGGYQVRLLPNSAKFAEQVLALYNHDSSEVIGNNKNGTLRFTSDETGVKFEVDLPDTSTGRDVAELVGKGYIAGMSFAMANRPDGREITENGKTIYEASSFLVDEFSVTGNPSFAGTTVKVKNEKTGDGMQRHSARIGQSLTLERLKLQSLSLPPAEIGV